MQPGNLIPKPMHRIRKQFINISPSSDMMDTANTFNDVNKALFSVR